MEDWDGRTRMLGCIAGLEASIPPKNDPVECFVDSVHTHTKSHLNGDHVLPLCDGFVVPHGCYDDRVKSIWFDFDERNPMLVMGWQAVVTYSLTMLDWMMEPAMVSSYMMETV